MITMRSTRPEADRYFIEMARHVSSRSTCLRRSVGCVLVSSKRRVLATGYNGVTSGSEHCNDFIVDQGCVSFPNACPAANAASGVNVDGCAAVHAEQNAVLQCADVDAVETAYVTTFPCPSCAKLLLNTGCKSIVYDQAYGDMAGFNLWMASGRLAYQFDGEPPMIQRDIVTLFGEGDRLNEWRVFVACICLNLASARVARSIIMRVLAMYPTPEAMSEAGPDLDRILIPLGLPARRSMHLRCMSRGWGTMPTELLLGVGPYALESAKVFCQGNLTGEHCDRKVAAWVNWKLGQQGS